MVWNDRPCCWKQALRVAGRRSFLLCCADALPPSNTPLTPSIYHLRSPLNPRLNPPELSLLCPFCSRPEGLLRIPVLRWRHRGNGLPMHLRQPRRWLLRRLRCHVSRLRGVHGGRVSARDRLEQLRVHGAVVRADAGGRGVGGDAVRVRLQVSAQTLG
jgi:hypothetical protein